MAGAPVENTGMNVGARATCKAFKKILDQFGLQIADPSYANFCLYDGYGATAKIDGGEAERFIHRHQKISSAEDATTVAESLVESFAESDADVFDGVMLIDVEVSGGNQFEIEAAVAGEEFEHVIEETNARRDFVFAVAFKGEGNANFCFGGFAM
jgi:hypothetical protein